MGTAPPFIIRLLQPADFNAALSVVQASEVADALLWRTTASELRARVAASPGDPRLNPADDRWVAAVREAGVVAYADGWPAGEGAQRSYRTSCCVHPDFRRRGIGRALMMRQCQRARAVARRLAAGNQAVTVTLAARALESQAAALAVFEAVGLRRVRAQLQMKRGLAGSLPQEAAPAGLRLEPWLDRRADEAVWQAYDEAFSDHWGHTRESFNGFMRRMSLGRVQREHSFIAWAGSQVAGGSLNDMGTDAAGRPAGEMAWIHHLFVRRAWRGRGLGRALVNASLARANQLGYASAGLNVDAENETGAVQLYQAAGFVTTTRRLVYQMAYTAAIDEGRTTNSA